MKNTVGADATQATDYISPPANDTHHDGHFLDIITLNQLLSLWAQAIALGGGLEAEVYQRSSEYLGRPTDDLQEVDRRNAECHDILHRISETQKRADEATHSLTAFLRRINPKLAEEFDKLSRGDVDTTKNVGSFSAVRASKTVKAFKTARTADILTKSTQISRPW